MKTILLSLLLTILVNSSYADFSRDYIDGHQLNTVTVNSIDIAYRVLGQGEDRPKVLMIMGLGGSNVAWGDNLIRGLVDHGYEVVIYDNRDTGASTSFDEWGQPTLWLQLLKHSLRLPVNAPYHLNDMAADAVALMDSIGYSKAHIVGVSMGGMIAQIVAARYPQRTRSLISIMSSTMARHLPAPTDLAEGRLRELAEGEAEAEREAAIRNRGFYPQTMPRHLMAIFKAGDRSAEVAGIQASTLVLHGADDGLLPPAHGMHTAELINDARFVLLQDMGHNIPTALVPDIVAHMTQHMQRVDTTEVNP
ncbi:MAG: alpha/beta fold hydrolase [Porticoccaceae bacterium]